MPKKYPTVAEAVANGLMHPGCRHRYGAYFPGISGPQEPQGKPEDYEHEQRQREIERKIREWKRREAAGDPKAGDYVKKWQQEARDHVAEHPNVNRRYDREKPMVGKGGQQRPPLQKPTPSQDAAPPPKPKPGLPYQEAADRRQYLESELRAARTRGYGLKNRDEIQENYAYVKDLEKQLERTYSTEKIDRLPKGAPRTPEAARAPVNGKPGANQLYDTADQDTYSNCTRVTVANELRTRGYDVTAAPMPNTKGQGDAGNLVWAKLWRTADGEYRPFTSAASENELREKMLQFPDGSRFAVSGPWKRGGGHIFNMEVRDGKVLVWEGQVPNPGDPARRATRYFSELRWGTPGSPAKFVSFLRIDDLVPTDDIVDKGWLR